jgi:hypothetical protein
MKMNRLPLIVCGLLAVILIATIGAVYTTNAQTNNATNQTTTPSHGNQTRIQGRCGRFNEMPRGPMMGYFPGMNLTASQRADLNQTMQTLRAQNATPQQIRDALQAKLEEYGVLDAQLNASIVSTQRRLSILNREQELRQQGYNWTTVESMIQTEYGQNTTQGPDSYGMMTPGRGHDDMPRGMMRRP